MPPKKGNATPPSSSASGSANHTRRSSSRSKKNSATTSGNGNASGSSRSTSQSKPRPKLPKDAAPAKKLTAAEIALQRMNKLTQGKSEEDMEQMLMQFLQQQQYEQAAYLIASSERLSCKFKLADVVRLMIEMGQLERAGGLIRDLKLQDNQPLVTLYINELVRCGLFHTAVRSAQELVSGFGTPGSDSVRDHAKPIWTPPALVQAMIRAQQYRTALKFAQQFGLLEAFPPAQLVLGMFQTQKWSEGVSSIMEHRLFNEFPLATLFVRLLEVRQWTCAVKCMNKLPPPHEQYMEMIVRESARVGDFLASLTYLREFKLDDPVKNAGLLKHFVDSLLTFKEFYKAIKYAIKFGLTPSDSDQPSSEDKYSIIALIRGAIEAEQYHVAMTYIKKLNLSQQLASEVTVIQQAYSQMATKFDQYLAAREASFSSHSAQAELQSILHRCARDEEWVDGEPIVVDVVIFQDEQIVETELNGEPEAINEQADDDEVILLNDSSRAFSWSQVENALKKVNSHQDAVKNSTSGSLPNPNQASSSPPPLPSSIPAPPPGWVHGQQPPYNSHLHVPSNFQHQQVSIHHRLASPPPPPPPPPPPLPQNEMPRRERFPPADSSMPPPPPPMPSFTPSAPPSSSSSNQASDVASLAMQFHFPTESRNRATYLTGVNNGQPPPPPPHHHHPHHHGPHPSNHYSVFYPPPPPTPPFPVAPPRSSFKPSMTFTSVTTRQKR